MDSKITNPKEDQIQDALSVVELEERHEMTVVAGELGRCNGGGKDKIAAAVE